ncbi:MAG: hypothetical protein MUD05_09440 [Candidatus Nanopelagicales bacterium]|jgi:hypothetical protein|nr:hypothetical protein [Candidatus Nanopelagicales bacterium]
MLTEFAVIAALAIAPVGVPGPINPEDGKIAGFVYGEEASNSYPGWLGTFPSTWTYSQQHIGYPGTATAGKQFYLHANTALVSPDAVGDVMVTIDEDAGGLPLRYAPTADMPIKCYYTQFDTVMKVSETPCRSSVVVESGQILVSKLEPLSPGFGFSVLVPVVTDKATSGTAAMTAMWAAPQVHLATPNVLATVPVTVAANPDPPAPTTITKPLPKKLRKYPKVKSLTPKVCKVKNRKVVVLKSGVCKLKGGKVVVKKRY